jgi:uncharacterized membrane protein
MATWKKVVWAIPVAIVLMASMFSQFGYARITPEQSVLTVPFVAAVVGLLTAGGYRAGCIRPY